MSSDSAVLAETFIDVAVDPERVWEALITDRGLEPWMGEGATIDARPNGALDVPDPVGGRRRQGRVERVEPERELAFTWWRTDRPTERSFVTISLSPQQTGTRVTVVEAPLQRLTPGFRATASAEVSSAAARSRSLIGTWSWRLAVLTLACQAVRV